MTLTPRWIAQASAAATSAVLIVVYRFSPSAYSFYPTCPSALWLHLECPGCGSTRALHALLHLRLAEAVAFNPMFPAVFLLAAVWGILQYSSATWQDRFVTVAAPRSFYWAASTAALGFFVIRNLS
jgi:hypothetical protein